MHSFRHEGCSKADDILQRKLLAPGARAGILGVQKRVWWGRRQGMGGRGRGFRTRNLLGALVRSPKAPPPRRRMLVAAGAPAAEAAETRPSAKTFLNMALER